MQCEGITRSGRRCRNKAFEDEIFCDIHLRVNQTYSLALLLPFLTILLLGYFFLYGIFFYTLVYGVFELSYLKFAGLSDFFVSMFRVGGMLTIVVLKSWLIFAIVIALGIAIALLANLSILTARLHLKLGQRLRIIGFSLAIYVLNFLHIFALLLPRRDDRHPHRILIGREHLARSLQAERQRILAPLPEASRDIISDYYRRFLTLATFSNHRFFAAILALFIISAASTLYAGYQAKDIRECIVNSAETLSNSTKEASKLPAMQLSRLCANSTDPAPRDVNVAEKFLNSLHSFFSFPAIVLISGGERIPLVYIGSTDKFELFFSGLTRQPLVLPIMNMGQLFNPAVEKPSPFTFKMMKELSHQSHKLDLMQAEMQSLLEREEQPLLSSIPSACWAIAPLALVEFKSGSADITEAAGRDLLVAYSRRFQETGSSRIIISGFTDPSGPLGLNMGLSFDRAETARDILVANGLEPNFVTAIGHGVDSQPHYPRRRVDIRDCTGIF